MRIHTALVSRGAYKQIIRTLIYAKKYINTLWLSINVLGEKILYLHTKVRIMYIIAVIVEETLLKITCQWAVFVLE